MDKRTLTALQGSIKKWEGIVAGTGEDKGYVNCPLCKEFIFVNRDEDDTEGCYGCPVYEKTGQPGCAGSPYDEWNEYKAKERDHLMTFDKESKRLAQAELDFLKSLLPHESD